jgi:hypothetical protein
MKKSPPTHMHKHNFFIIFSSPYDHVGQEIQGCVPVFIQQNGMEPEHIFRIESDNGLSLQHELPSLLRFYGKVTLIGKFFCAPSTLLAAASRRRPVWLPSVSLKPAHRLFDPINLFPFEMQVLILVNAQSRKNQVAA